MPLTPAQSDRAYLYHGPATSVHLRHAEAPSTLTGWPVVRSHRMYPGGAGSPDEALVEVRTECVIGTDGGLHFLVHAIFCDPCFSEDAPWIPSLYGRHEDLAAFDEGLRAALATGYGRAVDDAAATHRLAMAAMTAVLAPSA